MPSILRTLFISSVCAVASAQSTPGFVAMDTGLEVRIESDRGGAEVGLALLWALGTEADPPERSGDAALFGRWLGRRCARWERERGNPPATRIEVFGAGVALSFHGSTAAAAAWVEALSGWLRDPALDADEWAQVLAAARLAADDVEEYFPGAVVRQRARAALLGPLLGRAPTGRADDLAGRMPEDLERSVVERGGPCRAVVVGGVQRLTGWTPERWRQALSRLPEPSAVVPAPAPVPAIEAAAVGAPDRQGEHPTIDAVYGVVPVAVPSATDPGFAAFATAAEWLRLRAWRHFEGGSPQADAGRLPLLAFEPELAPRLLFFGHRGKSGADAAAWAEELDGFFDSLGRPTSADWLDARRSLRGRLWPEVPRRPRPGVGARTGAANAVRARALALGARFERPVEGELEALRDADLDSALDALLRERGEPWLLVPTRR